MKIRDLLEGGEWEKSIAADLKAKFAKKKADAAKQPKAEPRPAPVDPHPDKSTIWKKGFEHGKAVARGKRKGMDPKASSMYGKRTSEYEDGYEAGMNENTASSVASSMGGGNGFINGGPGTIKRRRNKKK